MRFLRIEKFIPFWGEELTAETTPFEVGRTFKVKFDHPADFIGKAALLQQKQRGFTKRLVQFQLRDFNKDTDYWPSGGEAVYRNGEYVGFVTNSAYGFTLHKMICLGFVQHPDTINGKEATIDLQWLLDKSAKWAINIAGKMVSANVNQRTRKIHLRSLLQIPCNMSPHPPKIPSLGKDSKEKPPPTKKGHAPTVNLFEKDIE